MGWDADVQTVSHVDGKGAALVHCHQCLNSAASCVLSTLSLDFSVGAVFSYSLVTPSIRQSQFIEEDIKKPEPFERKGSAVLFTLHGFLFNATGFLFCA